MGQTQKVWDNTRVGLNCEYGPNTEYQIIRFLKILWIPNTKFFGFWKWMNTKYRIVLFGFNYWNTKYFKSNSRPPKNVICEICDQMRWGKFDPQFSYLHEGFSLCFSIHILLINNSRTIRYSVTTIQVFKYYSEITNGPNTE